MFTVCYSQAVQCRLRSAVGVSLDLIIDWSCRYVAGQVQSCWKIHHAAAFIVTKAKVFPSEVFSPSFLLRPGFLELRLGPFKRSFNVTESRRVTIIGL